MKTKKYLVALLLLQIIVSAGIHAQDWTQIHAGTATGVTVLPNGAVVAVIDGTTYRSHDAGQSWTTGGAGPVSATALRVHPNGSIYTGSVFGREGLNSSTNEGASWISNGNIRAWDVAFNSQGDIFVATESSFILRSQDDGANWTELSDGGGGPPMWSIATDEQDNIYAGAQFGDIYRSTNSGTTWSLLPQQVPAIVEGLAVAADGTLYMSGATGLGLTDGSKPLVGFYRSTNRGSSWKDISPEDSAQVGKRVAITSSGTLYIATNSVRSPWPEDVLMSTNRGDNWESLAADMNFDHIGAIALDSQERLYVATGNGLYRLEAASSAPETTGSSKGNQVLAVISELNGADSYISVRLEESSNLRLQLIDMQGKEVGSIPLRTFSTGEHRFSLADLNLQPGLYLCRLTEGGAGVKVIVR